MKTGNPPRWFLSACLFELALLGIAALLNRLLQQPLGARSFWSAHAAVAGAVAATPLFVWFWWALQCRWQPLAATREFLERVIRPVFGSWTLLQLAVISILAGVCEETLFRGVIQAGLTPIAGPLPALLVASILFGLCHFVNWSYAVVATAIGLYLGWLFQLTGHLLSPIAAHAIYDFAALVYFLRRRSVS